MVISDLVVAIIQIHVAFVVLRGDFGAGGGDLGVISRAAVILVLIPRDASSNQRDQHGKADQDLSQSIHPFLVAWYRNGAMISFIPAWQLGIGIFPIRGGFGLVGGDGILADGGQILAQVG